METFDGLIEQLRTAAEAWHAVAEFSAHGGAAGVRHRARFRPGETPRMSRRSWSPNSNPPACRAKRPAMAAAAGAGRNPHRGWDPAGRAPSASPCRPPSMRNQDRAAHRAGPSPVSGGAPCGRSAVTGAGSSPERPRPLLGEAEFPRGLAAVAEWCLPTSSALTEGEVQESAAVHRSRGQITSRSCDRDLQRSQRPLVDRGTNYWKANYQIPYRMGLAWGQFGRDICRDPDQRLVHPPLVSSPSRL